MENAIPRSSKDELRNAVAKLRRSFFDEHPGIRRWNTRCLRWKHSAGNQISGTLPPPWSRSTLIAQGRASVSIQDEFRVDQFRNEVPYPGVVFDLVMRFVEKSGEPLVIIAIDSTMIVAHPKVAQNHSSRRVRWHDVSLSRS